MSLQRGTGRVDDPPGRPLFNTDLGGDLLESQSLAAEPDHINLVLAPTRGQLRHSVAGLGSLTGRGIGRDDFAWNVAVAAADVKSLLTQHVVLLRPCQPAVLLVDLVPHHARQVPAQVRALFEVRGMLTQTREKALPDRLDEISRVVLIT